MDPRDPDDLPPDPLIPDDEGVQPPAEWTEADPRNLEKMDKRRRAKLIAFIMFALTFILIATATYFA